MPGLKCRVFNRSKDIFPYEKRVIGENLFNGGARAQQMEDIRHTDAQAANVRPAPPHLPGSMVIR